MFIRGVKEGAVFTMQVNKKTLSKPTSKNILALPTMKDLKLVKKKENISSLDLSIQNHCLTKNFIPILSFLLKTVFKVINKTQEDAKELYMEILNEMKEFVNKTKVNLKFKEKSLEKSKEILCWLFLVITDKIKKVKLLICEDTQNLEYYRKIEKESF